MEAKLECNVCMQDFNDDENEPRIISSCGHTLCKFCLVQIATIDGMPASDFKNTQRIIGMLSSHEPNLSLVCPFCKTKNIKSLPEKFQMSDVLNAFPLNFTLISAISIIKKVPVQYEKCQSHGLPCSIACFDPSCGYRIFGCLDCLKVKHSNCRSCFAIDRSSIESRIEVINYERKYEKVLETLKEVKESIIRRFHKKIAKAFNIFAEKLKSVFYTIDLSNDSFFGGDLNKWMVSASDDSKTPKIRLMPRNKKKIDDELNVNNLFDKFKDFFSEHLTDLSPSVFDGFLKDLANPKKRIQIV